MKKLGNIISVILLIITFLLVILLIVTRIQGKTPRVFGYQLLRVSSSSMEPKLMVGDIILSKSIKDIESVEVGDIITYKGIKGSFAGKLITHEVVGAPALESDGKFYLQTMGFANSYPDPVISEDQVVGEMVCEVPFLSGVYTFFQTPFGLVVILLFLGVLFFNESVRLVNLVKGKDSQDEQEENVTEV